MATTKLTIASSMAGPRSMVQSARLPASASSFLAPAALRLPTYASPAVSSRRVTTPSAIFRKKAASGSSNSTGKSKTDATVVVVDETSKAEKVVEKVIAGEEEEDEEIGEGEQSEAELTAAAKLLLLQEEMARQEAEAAARLEEERRKAEVEAAALAAAREREMAEAARAREEELKRIERQRRMERLPALQEEHEFIQAKMFFYPEVPKAGGTVEVFFHRPVSALADKSGVFVVGGFNNWQWEQFTGELKPCADVSNDWWVTTLSIPKEAYRVDFVFHSSDNVYENNDGNDFYIAVEGGMEEYEFETMLNERKREEAERLAAEEAERARVAEEERRVAQLKAQQEAEANAAKNMANETRHRLGEALRSASDRVDGLWSLETVGVSEEGTRVKLSYNRASRPLSGCQAVWMHGGRNGWEAGVSIVEELKLEHSKDGNWWSAEFVVPPGTLLLNWVFADGPVGKAGSYDNNNRKDFVARVGTEEEQQAYFDALEERYRKKLEVERLEREATAAAEAKRRAELKAAMKARTKETFLQSQAHVFYTEPAEPRAGESVRVFYNPNNTVLHGRDRVWMRGSFNRWTHRSGCWLPIQMEPAPNGTHLMAEVQVPIDSFIMDLVFMDNESPEHAIYDNRNGLDYHVPVVGGSVQEPPMYIVHVALEMAPVAKVGGLGDVVTSLSRAVIELGHKVEVVLPKYDCLKYNNVDCLEEKEAFTWGGTTWRTWFGFVEGVPVHFLEPQSGIFWVGCIYGRKDDAARFGTFCHAALEFLLQTGRRPDIIHSHDWSSAPVSWLHSEQYSHYGLGNARSVFTIHNLEFGQALIGRAMAACNKATTVSPTYAWEIGGHGAIAPHNGKFSGILNGIDPDIWDPMSDPFIPKKYGPDEMLAGKQAAKEELRRRLNLRFEDRPVVGIVTRLTAQKGIHLIKHAIWRTLDRGGQAVLLGSAPDPRVQKEFEDLAASLNNSHNNQARLWLSYDEPLSHLIYAGCDMIVVPSIFEPCGLTQLIAMRYGAIPVVRKTGGLNDTVLDVDNDKERAAGRGLEPNGFSFEGTDTAGVDYALNRAISGWYEGREWWNGMAKKVMEQDWTWNRPALDYLELYYGARK